MLTVDDCVRSAWQALLRGDTAARDRYCALAKNIMAMQDRRVQGMPADAAICASDMPINLQKPDASEQQ